MSLPWLIIMGYALMGCANLLIHRASFVQDNIKCIACKAQDFQRQHGGDVLPLEVLMPSIRKSMLFVGFFLWPVRLFIPWPEPKSNEQT